MTPVTPVLMDGAMGTTLLARGWPRSRPTALACLEAPHLVENVHRDYVAAGARILLTNTFVADSPPLVDAALTLARAAAPGRTLVALSLGPTGLRDLDGLCPPDLLLLETFSDPAELRDALDARDRSMPGVPVLVSLFGTPERLDVLEALVRVLDGRPGISGVGLNCWSTPEGLLAGFRALKPLHPGPYLARPSLPPDGPGAWIDLAHELVESGVTWIGGCCGTTPAEIARLGRWLR